MSNNLRMWLSDRLTKKRYIHSVEVAKRAAFLAKLYGVNAKKAKLAGLLHDCCHCMPQDGQLKVIASHGILLDDFTLAQPKLWHAKAGSLLIQSELGITDPDIISAVEFHTTGRAGMTEFEQIIYLADLTSADRNYPDTRAYRKLSEKSLEECMMKNLADTLNMLAKQGHPIVRDAWEAYNYFWKLTNERD